MQNSTRAILPSLMLLLTSSKPSPIDLQTGIPTGQPNSIVAMSVPKAFRSSGSSALSHSRTGSLPPAFR